MVRQCGCDEEWRRGENNGEGTEYIWCDGEDKERRRICDGGGRGNDLQVSVCE